MALSKEINLKRNTSVGVGGEDELSCHCTRRRTIFSAPLSRKLPGAVTFCTCQGHISLAVLQITPKPAEQQSGQGCALCHVHFFFFFCFEYLPDVGFFSSLKCHVTLGR